MYPLNFLITKINRINTCTENIKQVEGINKEVTHVHLHPTIIMYILEVKIFESLHQLCNIFLLSTTQDGICSKEDFHFDFPT